MPGEGEHKIMDFIRYEKSQDDYDPNTRHCLYGHDADLVSSCLQSSFLFHFSFHFSILLCFTVILSLNILFFVSMNYFFTSLLL